MTKRIKKENRRGIYKNTYDWISDEDLMEHFCDSRGINPDEVTGEDLMEEKSFLEGTYYDDDIENLNIRTDGRILAIADMGLWNGRVQGYKLGKNNVNEVMSIGNSDEFELYQDRYDIRKISYHHDGRNYILFREIREDRSEEGIENFLNSIYNGEEISRRKLNYYTKSLNHYVDEVFGKYF